MEQILEESMVKQASGSQAEENHRAVVLLVGRGLGQMAPPSYSTEDGPMPLGWRGGSAIARLLLQVTSVGCLSCEILDWQGGQLGIVF